MGINIVNYNGKAIVDLSKDTVTPSSMLSGTTAHNAAGDIITGNLIVGEQVNADWNATEGAAAILNKPPLSAVATSGNYADLQNKPSTMTGATAEAAGTSGFVPAPSAGDENKVLKGDGTWGAVSPTRDTSSSSTISVKGNTVYSPGSLSSLTLSAIEISDQESLIYFTTSTSTNFSFSLPAGTKYIGAFSFSPSTQYVVSILNGIVVMGEVSVEGGA